MATSERNNHQCNPSFTIKSDEKTYLTQRVTTTRRNTQEKWRQRPRSEQRVEAPTHRAPRSGTQREGAGPILLEGGIATRTIAGRRTLFQPEEGYPNTKARNQTHQKEGKSSLWSRTEEEHSPDLRQVTQLRRLRTQQDRGTQRHRGPTRASRPASDRKRG